MDDKEAKDKLTFFSREAEDGQVLIQIEMPVGDPIFLPIDKNLSKAEKRGVCVQLSSIFRSGMEFGITQKTKAYNKTIAVKQAMGEAKDQRYFQ